VLSNYFTIFILFQFILIVLNTLVNECSVALQVRDIGPCINTVVFRSFNLNFSHV
jgi:hypothetical protein